MHTRYYYKSVLETCHFLPAAGNYLTLFWLFVSFVWNWHLSQKKPRRCSALMLPFQWRRPMSEREREREREERERGGEREEERVGQKTQKRERFRDGKGEEGGG